MKISFKGRKAYPSGPSTVLSVPKTILDNIVEQHGDLDKIRFDLIYDGDKLVYNIVHMVSVEDNEQSQAL